MGRGQMFTAPYFSKRPFQGKGRGEVHALEDQLAMLAGAGRGSRFAGREALRFAS